MCSPSRLASCAPAERALSVLVVGRRKSGLSAAAVSAGVDDGAGEGIVDLRWR